VRALDGVAPERRDRVEWAKKQLRRARLERRQRLEEGAVSVAVGEELVAEIVGIDRALNALESLGEPDLESQVERAETADAKRWYTFLETALGRDDDGATRGPR
jgi:hypothetical protein